MVTQTKRNPTPEIVLRPLHPVSATSRRALPSRDKRGGKFAKDIITGDFTSHFTYANVPVERLLVDRRYQRDLIPSWVSKLAHDWNEDKNNPFVVSLRENGNFYVMDGQQRHAALQMMTNPPDFIFAKVFKGLTLQQEADLFNSYAEDRKSLTQATRFKSALVAEHPWAVSVHRAAENSGFGYVNNSPGSNSLRAISAARTIYNRRGEALLTRILTIARQAWPKAESAGRSSVLFGLEYFLMKYPESKDEITVQKLQEAFPSGPRGLENTAHGYAEQLHSSIGPATGYAIYQAYNKALRSARLAPWSI